jgi:DNA-binding CsgD family transcriptional regulator
MSEPIFGFLPHDITSVGLHKKFSEGIFIVGRSSKCDFTIPDITISRQHARLIVNQNECCLEDLNSHNGTYIGDIKITHAKLKADDIVRFGRIKFRISMNGEDPLKFEDSRDSTRDILESLNEIPTIDLSPAQRRVFEGLLSGLAEKEIASKLSLSRHTIHNHVRKIYLIAGVNSRPELLAKFVRHHMA